MARPRFRSSWLAATLLAASCLTPLAGTAIAPALPAIRTHFAAAPNAELLVGLVLTITSLFVVLGAPGIGFLVDRLGCKPTLIGSLALFGVAGTSVYWLGSLVGIVIARAAMGVAVVGISTSVTTLMASYYAGEARTRIIGLQSACLAFTGVVFIILGGFLADLAWRSLFLIYLVAFAVLPFAAILLYEPQREPDARTKGDDAKYAQSRSRSASTRVARRGALFFGSGTLRAAAPIYGLVMLTEMVFYLVPAQLPFYLRSLNGSSATLSGLAIALDALCCGISSLMHASLARRLSFSSIAILALVLLGFGYGAIGLATTSWQMVIGLGLAGCGVGFMIPNLNLWLVARTPAAARGRALSGLTTFFYLGRFVSPLFSQPVSRSFGMAAVFYLAGALVLALGLAFAGLRAWSRRSPIPRVVLGGPDV